MDFIPPPFPLANTNPIEDDQPMAGTSESDGVKESTPKRRKRTASMSDHDTTENDDDNKSVALSDMSDTLPETERVALALSCRDEGNRKLKEGDLDGAIQMYEDGISKMKNVLGVGDEGLESSVKEARLALNLNLSLCRMKQNEWMKAIRAATSALQVDPENVKGLFRRGTARSRAGFLEEARVDLVQACKLDPSNADARKELAAVKQRASEAKSRDKKAFEGLFSKTAGMYEDREKQMKAERQKQEEKRKAEMKEYESENKARESKGEEPIKSFDEWKEQKEKKEKEAEEEKKKQQQKNNNTSTTSFKSSNNKTDSVNDVELDEEDKKILDETKKMGYCYFNRKIDDEEKARLQKANRPVKIDAPTESSESVVESQPQKALSLWNSGGTTYEERDCSSWAHTTLSNRLKSLEKIQTSPKQQQLQQYIEMIKSPTPSISETTKLAAQIVPTKISVSEVSPIEGDAQIIVLKGSKRYLYDFKIELKWKVEIPNDLPLLAPLSNDDAIDPSKLPADDDDLTPSAIIAASSSSSSSTVIVLNGSISFHDVSSAASTRSTNATDENGMARVDWLEDARVIIKSQQPSTQLQRLVLSNALEALKNQIYDAVKSFEEDDFKNFA